MYVGNFGKPEPVTRRLYNFETSLTESLTYDLLLDFIFSDNHSYSSVIVVQLQFLHSRSRHPAMDSCCRTESLHSLLQRSLPETQECLDQGIIDISSRLTIVELNESDQNAVHHYISYLVRKIIGISDYFQVVSDQEPLTSNANLRDSNANVSSITSKKDLSDTQSDSIIMNTSHPNLYLDDEDIASSWSQVVILDELLSFDVSHFVNNVPSDEVLRDVKILRQTDAFSCLGESFCKILLSRTRHMILTTCSIVLSPSLVTVSLSRFLEKEVVFHQQLKLLVLCVSDSFLDAILDLLTRSQLHCKVLLLCHFVSKRDLPSGVKRIRVESDPKHPANFTVTRFKSNNDDERHERRLQVHGKRKLEIKKEEA